MVTRRYGARTHKFDWPRGWRMLDLCPDERAVVIDDLDIIEDALDEPTGSRRLERRVKKGESVAMVVADETAAMRHELLLPAVLGRLKRAGAGEATVLVAGSQGAAPVVGQERLDWLAGLPGVGEVLLHDPAADNLVDKGKTSRGTPILVHPLLEEADALVVVGQVNFNFVTGYSGGPVTLALGACGAETARACQRLVFKSDGRRHPRAATARMQGNPCYEDAAEVAAALKPAFFADALLDLEGRVSRVFCGEMRTAHLEGARVLRGFYRLIQPRPSTVVAAAGGTPYDDTLLSAMGGIQHWYRCVKPRGMLLFSASCSQGLGSNRLVKWAQLPPHQLRTEVLNGEYDPTGLAVLALREAQYHCKILLHSVMDPAQVEFFGFEPAESFPAGLMRLKELAGESLPRGSWVPAASQTLGIPTT